MHYKIEYIKKNTLEGLKTAVDARIQELNAEGFSIVSNQFQVIEHPTDGYKFFAALTYGATQTRALYIYENNIKEFHQKVETALKEIEDDLTRDFVNVHVNIMQRDDFAPHHCTAVILYRVI